jgi:hypothetical protein
MERTLKREARSLDEWLHELYCLTPDLWTWFEPLRVASGATRSDGLGKYDRVLNEILADIGTSISIPSVAVNDGGTFSDIYLLKPLLEHRGDIEATRLYIRGLCRGRTIIPQMWFEFANDVCQRSSNRDGFADGRKSEGCEISTLRALLTPEDRLVLDAADSACAFGRSISEHWNGDESSDVLLGFALNA